MAERTYRDFTTGITQDDVLPIWMPSFLDAKNIDWLKTGYWAKLWPKVNKGIITDVPMRAMGLYQPNTWPALVLAWGDEHKIYRVDGTDNTPVYTIDTTTFSPVKIFGIVYVSPDFYILYNSPGWQRIWRINITNVVDDDWDEFIENWLTPELGIPTYIPPILRTANEEIMLPLREREVWVIDLWSPLLLFNSRFLDDRLVGITEQGTTYMLYSASGTVYAWDWASELTSARFQLGARISKVVQKQGIDYITSEDGQLYIWQGFWFQRVTKPRKTNRNNDNTTYGKVLSFAPLNDLQNRLSVSVQDDVYLWTDDEVKGIYRYGAILPWVAPWFHKVITQNHLWNDIDEVYDMLYSDRERRLYISYRTGSTYGIDYIDLDSLECASEGYFVTEVFSANTSYEKEIKAIRKATSNTNGSNAITIYYRVDNGAWELVRNINELQASITVWEPITTANGQTFKKYRDRQYKVVFTNANGGDNTPILHELQEFYDVINK